MQPGQLAPQIGLLTVDEERFVDHYFETGHAYRSAMAVWGYTNLTTAASQAYKVLKRPAVKARLRELGRPILEKTDITAQRVMLQLARHGFRDVRQAFDADGKLLPVALMPEDIAASVASFECETRVKGSGDEAYEVVITKVKFVDPTAALGMLAKHFKLIGDVGDGVDALANELAARLTAARKRVDVVDVEVIEGVGDGGEPAFEEGAIPLIGSHPQQTEIQKHDFPVDTRENPPVKKRKSNQPTGKRKKSYAERTPTVTIPAPTATIPAASPDEEQLW